MQRKNFFRLKGDSKMNLKKITGILATCVMAGALFTGCGGDTPAKTSDDVKIGMIKHLNVTETKLDELLKSVEEKANIKLSMHVTTFYDSLPLLKMGLESTSIEEASTYKCVADYLMARDPKIEIVNGHNPAHLYDNFAFAMRASDTELKQQIDDAINAMKTDGTLDQITKTYITDLKGAEDPPSVAIETFDGAEPLKIGVTGDLPPLDLVLANGEIAGFNTAMLAEIGKRLHRNIQIVQIDSASRAAALASNNIDVAFWAVIPSSEDMPMDIDKSEGVELSTPYFKDEIIHIQLKK